MDTETPLTLERLGLLTRYDIRRMNVGSHEPRTAQAAAGGRLVHAVQPSVFCGVVGVREGNGRLLRGRSKGQASLGQLICTFRLLAKQSRKYKLIRL